MAPIASAARRVRSALTTWPSRASWGRATGELLWLAPVLVALGIVGGFAEFAPVDDIAALLQLALLLLVVPALGEELLFRAALQPDPRGPASPIVIIGSIALFVAWHPLQVFAFGPPWAEMFLNPWFLAATAALGIAVTRAYRATLSIWPSVAIHWLAVFSWKALAGGPSAISG